MKIRNAIFLILLSLMLTSCELTTVLGMWDLQGKNGKHQTLTFKENKTFTSKVYSDSILISEDFGMWKKNGDTIYIYNQNERIGEKLVIEQMSQDHLTLLCYDGFTCIWNCVYIDPDGSRLDNFNEVLKLKSEFWYSVKEMVILVVLISCGLCILGSVCKGVFYVVEYILERFRKN